MTMKLSYKQRILGCFLFIFILFAVCVIFFEQKRSNDERMRVFSNQLNSYSQIINNYISQNHITDSTITDINPIINTLPQYIRFTIINNNGKVLYDKNVTDINALDSHINRPEIKSATTQDFGTDIRSSSSTQKKYIYFAKSYDDYYIRMALPYNNTQAQELFTTDKVFIYFVVILFVLVFIMLNYVSERFSKSIIKLKNVVTCIRDNKPIPSDIQFRNDELGETSRQLVDIFQQIEKNNEIIKVERQRFIQHFQYSELGLCFFSANFEKIYANAHFIQYLNLITDNAVLNITEIFKENLFSSIVDFLKDKDKTTNLHYFQVAKSGKMLGIQTIVFQDESFEITIKDVTKVEKTRQIKQEMTDNIAHELRTPITSMRGYLETIVSYPKLTDDKKDQFINKAYQQSIRLSNLIEDVSILSKIEDDSMHFTKEKVNISQLIEEIRIDFTKQLSDNKIKLIYNIKSDLYIIGNYSLLYAIFRNLIENAIFYGGKNVEIHIENYFEDENYLYFSFFDTGVGVDEKYLNRLFERFYRIDEGRVRNAGGSGLGLSIVKNAVLVHKGNIQAKNRLEGGLEFLFTLKREV